LAQLMRTLLFLAIPLFAQVTPTECTFHQQVGGPPDFACVLQVTEVGAWTTDTASLPTPLIVPSSGTGATTVRLRTGGYNLSNPGTYVEPITVAGVTVTVTTIVSPRWVLPIYSNARGLADSALGCTQDSPAEKWWFYNVCSPTSPRPGGTFNMPTAGQGYVDNSFGSFVRGIGMRSQTYTNYNAISRDNKYCMSDPLSLGTEATVGIFDCEQGLKVYDHPRSLNSLYVNCQFSAITNGTIYCDAQGSSAAIYKVTLGTPPTLNDDGAIWTEPNAKNISHGGSNAVTRDDHLAVYTTDQTWLYDVDLTAGTATPLDLSTISPALDGPNGIDYVLSGNGCDTTLSPPRCYIWMGVDRGVQTYDAGRRFSWVPGDATLTYDGMGPAWSELPFTTSPGPTWQQPCNVAAATSPTGCQAGGHGTTAAAPNGSQYFVIPTERNYGEYQGYVSTFRFSSGDSMGQGGVGLGGVSWLTSGLSTHQMGARLGPYVVTSHRPDAGPDEFIMTNCTNVTTTVTCTTNRAHGFEPADEVLIGGATGMSGVNGVQTLTSASGTTLEFTATVSGTYTANSGAATRNTAYALAGQQQEIQVVRLGDQGQAIQVFRIAPHRSVGFDDGSGDQGYAYFPFPLINLDADGNALVLWNSNGGVPNSPAPYFSKIARLPYAENEFSRGRGAYPTVTAGQISFRLQPASPSPITCSISETIDLASPTTSTATAGTGDKTMTFSGLDSAQYWWRCVSADNRYVATDTVVVP
jgi:hypothetical protein